MTAKAALCLALLEGKVLNVNNCAKMIGLSNIAREVPRLVEKVFDVEVSRSPMKGKNRYGSLTHYTNYRLNKSDHNQPGIERMKTYVKGELLKNKVAPTTEKMKTMYKQIDLFLNQ